MAMNAVLQINPPHPRGVKGGEHQVVDAWAERVEENTTMFLAILPRIMLAAGIFTRPIRPTSAAEVFGWD